MKKVILLLSVGTILSSCVPNNNVSRGNIAIQQQAELITKAAQAKKNYLMGKYKQATADYNEIISEISNDSDNMFFYAESLRLSGDAEDSIKQYDAVIQTGKNKLEAMEGKGLAYIELGKFKEAAELLSEVVGEDAARWRTINALGVIYSSTGHLKESLKYYNMALELSDNNPSVMNNIGLSKAFGGQMEEGRRIIEQSLAKAKDSDKRRQIELNLALIHGISGDTDKAEEILVKYLPKHKVMNNLGFYAKLADDKELAKSYLSKALSSSPVHYEKAWDNMQGL